MAWKYRRRLSLFPGFRVNLSKTGMSATIGVRGFNVNVGPHGTFVNTGIPGTGIYDRINLNDKQNGQVPKDKPIDKTPLEQPIVYQIEEIKSYNPELLTSEGLYGIKESILNAKKEKQELLVDCQKAIKAKKVAKFWLIFSYVLLFGFLIKWFRENYKERCADVKYAHDAYARCKLEIDFEFDTAIQNDYITLKKCFTQLTQISSIWDITSTSATNKVLTRSAADKNITRQKVNFSPDTLSFVETKHEALQMQNINGGDLYLYPGFIVMIDKRSNDFGLIDFRDVSVEYHLQNFIEEEQVPNDTKIVGQTWRYVNKNGMPDKRFKNNPEIPIVQYCDLILSTSKGLREGFTFSNPDIGFEFCNALNNYKEILAKMNWSSEQKQIENLK